MFFFSEKSKAHTIKFVSIDRFTTRSISPSKITTLEHELGDHTMESRSCVSEAILAGAELAEVACRYGHDIVIQLEHDPTSWPSCDSDIELRSEKSAFVLDI